MSRNVELQFSFTEIKIETGRFEFCNKVGMQFKAVSDLHLFRNRDSCYKMISYSTECSSFGEFDVRMEVCQIRNPSWSLEKILLFHRTCLQMLKRGEDQGRGSKSSCDSQREQRVEVVSRPRSLGEIK